MDGGLALWPGLCEVAASDDATGREGWGFASEMGFPFCYSSWGFVGLGFAKPPQATMSLALLAGELGLGFAEPSRATTPMGGIF